VNKLFIAEAEFNYKMFTMENFSLWLLNELEKRNWQPADLAKKARISRGSLSNILSNYRNPGPNLCLAIAQALNEPPEKVFRLAGLLPPLPGGEDEQISREVMDILRNMSPENRQDLLNYARYRYQQQEGKRGK
jgi:transcriptional regulator with XRE-family HTH domain